MTEGVENSWGYIPDPVPPFEALDRAKLETLLYLYRSSKYRNESVRFAQQVLLVGATDQRSNLISFPITQAAYPLFEYPAPLAPV